MIKERNIKKVRVLYGTRSKIAGLFHVTPKTVSHALSGKCNNELAQKIRIAAVELGGDPIYN